MLDLELKRNVLAGHRLIWITVNITDGEHRLCACTTVRCVDEEKGQFWEQKDDMTHYIQLWIVGDRNEHVREDNIGVSDCMGRIEVGERIDFENRIVNLTVSVGLVITNTFFCKRMSQKDSIHEWWQQHVSGLCAEDQC